VEFQFPLPTYFGKRRAWRESSVVNYERGLDGLTPIERDPAQERWLTAAQMRERFGHVSDMWLWRRIKEAEHALASKPMEAA
jgi:hypothetical protein